MEGGLFFRSLIKIKDRLGHKKFSLTRLQLENLIFHKPAQTYT